MTLQAWREQNHTYSTYTFPKNRPSADLPYCLLLSQNHLNVVISMTDTLSQRPCVLCNLYCLRVATWIKWSFVLKWFEFPLLLCQLIYEDVYVLLDLKLHTLLQKSLYSLELLQMYWSHTKVELTHKPHHAHFGLGVIHITISQLQVLFFPSVVPIAMDYCSREVGKASRASILLLNY